MSPLSTSVAAAVAAVLAIPLLAFSGGQDAACSTVTPTITDGQAGAASEVANDPGGGVQEFDTEQLANARTIITIGEARGIPAWGWVVGIATALQESRLRNPPDGHSDSIGLFQQRPSQGWGTPAQLTSTTYQTEKFYDALLHVPGWQHLPLTQAAQAVQRSAYPDAYAQWAGTATRLVNRLAPQRGLPSGMLPQPAGSACLLDEGDGLPPGGTTAMPAGYTIPIGTPAPVASAIRRALAQVGTPYSYGGDCTNPHGGNPAHQCDCSSLTQQAYRAAGIPVPRTTTDQATTGVAVAGIGQLRPGDLIFIPGSLGTAAHPRHVGLYLGAGLLVNAPRTGADVEIRPLKDWSGQITKIRRLVPSPISPKFS